MTTTAKQAATVVYSKYGFSYVFDGYTSSRPFAICVCSLPQHLEKANDWTHPRLLKTKAGQVRTFGSRRAAELAVYRAGGLTLVKEPEPRADRHAPSRDGSDRCASGSIASGGRRSYCTCDTCY